MTGRFAMIASEHPAAFAGRVAAIDKTAASAVAIVRDDPINIDDTPRANPKDLSGCPAKHFEAGRGNDLSERLFFGANKHGFTDQQKQEERAPCRKQRRIGTKIAHRQPKVVCHEIGKTQPHPDDGANEQRA